MASAIIGGVATAGKELWIYIYPKISNIIKFKSNLQKLRKEMENLRNIVQSVQERTQAAIRGGRVLSPEVLKWLNDFEEITNKMDLLESKIDAKVKYHETCSSRCILGSEVVKHRIEVNRLVEHGSFPYGLVVENFSVETVEHIPGPVIEDQSTASKNLIKVLELLNNDSVNIIGVWGMGGVGKTTLVKNLNNILETSDDGKQFSIIMWATASKNADIRSIQSQLVNRLNLEVKKGENKESTSSRLHQRLKQEKRYLFILDDVWEHIDLDSLGLSDHDKGNKIILTTRSMDVCRQMKTDVEVRVDVLNEHESWQLFIQNAGPVASHIESIAKKVSLECCGLPLAIIVVGASMRGKKTITLWTDALNAIKKSVPNSKGIEEMVYKPLKWSYDSLYFQNMNIKSCFLYCCLYPNDSLIHVNELVLCWIGEGLITDYDSYEDMVNTGISMVEYLKDSCLLEDGVQIETVKMHDVVRDVAIWIASSLEDDCKSYVLSRFTKRNFLEEVFQGNYKRVSLIDIFTGGLPSCSKQNPLVLSLLLHGESLTDIPEEFLLAFPSLRVLVLKNTSVTTYPNSLGQLSEFRALQLQYFSEFRSLLLQNFSDFRSLELQYFGTNRLPPVGELHKLQVLDCSFFNLRTLPEGIEKLKNLRSLRLLETPLDHIEDGVISKLTRLEILDMSGSEYKWDVSGKRRTPFDELRCLNQLSFLSIYLDMSSSSTTDFSWLTRVKRFILVVGKTYPWFFSVDKTLYERKVGIWGEELSGVGYRSLVQTASCVILQKCKQIERLWIDLDKGDSYRGLKSLRVIECVSSFQLVSGVLLKIDKLPNLEELILDGLDGVESISQLMQCLGSRFTKLKTFKVYSCNNFRFLFGKEDLWQKLETLEVFRCNRIKKLPFNSASTRSINEIRGTQKWWDQLEWDDQHSKLSLQHCFKPIPGC